MIIQKIEICNFRSYYKSNTFELDNGLNLIIGSNGDGKTTFYEALEWLFRTDGTNKMDSKYISKKRIVTLQQFSLVNYCCTFSSATLFNLLSSIVLASALNSASV